MADIEGSALARPRSAGVLARSRLKASAASGFVTAQPWRFSVPAGGWRMEKLCEVRVSSCPLIDSLGNNSGLGVWTVARVQAGTLLFWDMSRTRMVPYGKASLTELRYGVRKISRPRVVLLCPGGRGMQNLDNRTACNWNRLPGQFRCARPSCERTAAWWLPRSWSVLSCNARSRTVA